MYIILLSTHPVEFSDHCLISVYIKSQVQREITPEIKKIPVGQYKWDQDSVDFYFRMHYWKKKSVEGILHLNSILDYNNFNDIDLLVSNASNIYLKTASNTLFYKKKNLGQKKTWMSSNCLLLCREVWSLGEKLQKDPTNIWIKHTFSFSNCVKEYNKLRKNLKKQFYHSFQHFLTK